MLSMEVSEVRCVVVGGGAIYFDNRTGKGAGSGFIAQSGDHQYLYTNVHNLTGASKVTCVTMGGDKVTDFDSLEVSADDSIPDVARLKLKKPRKSPFHFPPPDFLPRLKSKVVGFGDSGGEKAITQLRGVIQAVGPALLESDVGFIQGNSGGPLIDEETGAVIGINTFVTFVSQSQGEQFTKGTRFEQGRRFSYRPDKVAKWRPMDLGGLVAERRRIDDVQRGTWALTQLLSPELTPTRLGFKLADPKREAARAAKLKANLDKIGETRDPLVRRILNGIAEIDAKLHQTTAVASVSRQPARPLSSPPYPADRKPPSGPRVGNHEALQTYQSFYTGVLNAADAGLTGLNRQTLCPFHYKEFEDAKATRDLVVKWLKLRVEDLKASDKEP